MSVWCNDREMLVFFKSDRGAANYIKKKIKPRLGKIRKQYNCGRLDWSINANWTQTQEKKKNNSGRSDITSHTCRSQTQNTGSTASENYKPVTTLHRPQPAETNYIDGG